MAEVVVTLKLELENAFKDKLVSCFFLRSTEVSKSFALTYIEWVRTNSVASK